MLKLFFIFCVWCFNNEERKKKNLRIFILTRMHLIKKQKKDIQTVIAKYALITA